MTYYFDLNMGFDSQVFHKFRYSRAQLDQLSLSKALTDNLGGLEANGLHCATQDLQTILTDNRRVTWCRHILLAIIFTLIVCDDQTIPTCSQYFSE
jgi:hypothetical protein